MYRGTGASAGIGIGKAVLVRETELVVTKQNVVDAEVELGRFKARFGADVCDVYKEAVNKLENMGWLTVDQRFMRLTDRGLDMQNSALMEFMQ